LVGHNPGLQQLLVALAHNDRDGLRSRVEQKFPTAALAALELPAHRWTEVRSGSGRITELILPKKLD
jgi:phosphohistidine phosphatase